MEIIISILVVVVLLAAIGVCLYLITTLSRVNAVLDEIKAISQSVKPIIATVQTTSTRLTPIVDNVEAMLRKLQPVIDNMENLASAAQSIANKVDKQVDQVLVTLSDAARLSQDIIRLIDDIRVQIIGPVTGAAQFITTAYKTVSGLMSGINAFSSSFSGRQRSPRASVQKSKKAEESE